MSEDLDTQSDFDKSFITKKAGQVEPFLSLICSRLVDPEYNLDFLAKICQKKVRVAIYGRNGKKDMQSTHWQTLLHSYKDHRKAMTKKKLNKVS